MPMTTEEKPIIDELWAGCSSVVQKVWNAENKISIPALSDEGCDEETDGMIIQDIDDASHRYGQLKVMLGSTTVTL